MAGAGVLTSTLVARGSAGHHAISMMRHACACTAAALFMASRVVGLPDGPFRQLQSASAGDPSCLDFDARVAAVNAECCDEPAEDCSSGQPSTCNLGCARVLLPFFDDCGSTPSGSSVVAAFDDVARLCQNTLSVDASAKGQPMAHCLIRGNDAAYESFSCSPDSPAYTPDGFQIQTSVYSPVTFAVAPGCSTPQWARAKTSLCDNTHMGDHGTCTGLIAAASGEYEDQDPKEVCPPDGQGSGSGTGVDQPADGSTHPTLTWAVTVAASNDGADWTTVQATVHQQRSCAAAIEGSFGWKMSYAAQQGCRPVGSPIIPPSSTSDDPSDDMIQGMYCPASMQQGAPPFVDGPEGELTVQRSWGDCYIPQTKAAGGHAVARELLPGSK